MKKNPDTSFTHSEDILQWVWEHLLFNTSALYTECGKNIKLLNQGTLNTTNGPDFRKAALVIDGIEWYGDIEIHIHSKSWNHHDHQKDPNFNSVVLHVVAEENPVPVQCKNGAHPYTLNIFPYLKPGLHHFLKKSTPSDTLPCASGFNFISEEAFNKQIEKAHREYFDKKADDFLSFYDPGLPPGTAWKHAFIISLFDGLGIPHNRKAMRSVAGELLKIFPGSKPEAVEKALTIAALNEQCASDIFWNLKSVRPASHPRKRITQGALLAYEILNTPYKDFLNINVIHYWEMLLSHTAIKNTGHFRVLYGTVFLPSLYVLGNLFAINKLSEAAFSTWVSLKTPIPKSVVSRFQSLSVNNSGYRKKLGSVHQLKSYCTPGRCSECFVLKSAIQS